MPEKIEELKTEILALRKQFYAGYDKLNPNEVPINGFFAMMEMSFRKLHAISLLALNEKQSPPSQNGWIDDCYNKACELSGKTYSKVSFEHEGMKYTVYPARLGRKVRQLEQEIANLKPQPPIKGE